MREAVQGSMIIEVLLDREIEIEGRLLEHDAHSSEAFRGPLADVHAEDADHSLALDIEPGGKREERRLSGAVQAEQHGEIAPAPENQTSLNTRRGPKRCPSPSMESAVRSVMRGSRAGHHAPRRLADGNGFDHLERTDVDHRYVVADPVRRVDPALIRIERQAPYPLADQQMA